jgi:CheY-like chemotaxis protein
MATELETKSGRTEAAGMKTIVFVENESADYLVARNELSWLGILNPVHRLSTVSALMDYLKQANRQRKTDPAALPCVILMELRLPQTSGLDGQAWIRSNADFRDIPIIAMSAADRLNSLKYAKEMGADAYLVKPFAAQDFSTIATSLQLPLRYEDQAANGSQGSDSFVATDQREASRTFRGGIASLAKRLGLF